MLQEKIEILRKKSNKEEVALIIKEDDMLTFLKKIVKLKLNRISFIEVYGKSDDRKWSVIIKMSELEFELLIKELKGLEVYTCEEDKFGRYYEKRLGV